MQPHPALDMPIPDGSRVPYRRLGGACGWTVPHLFCGLTSGCQHLLTKSSARRNRRGQADDGSGNGGWTTYVASDCMSIFGKSSKVTLGFPIPPHS
jgi:hypothetical protein